MVPFFLISFCLCRCFSCFLRCPVFFLGILNTRLSKSNFLQIYKCDSTFRWKSDTSVDLAAQKINSWFFLLFFMPNYEHWRIYAKIRLPKLRIILFPKVLNMFFKIPIHVLKLLLGRKFLLNNFKMLTDNICF